MWRRNQSHPRLVCREPFHDLTLADLMLKKLGHIGCSKSIDNDYNAIKSWNRKILRECSRHTWSPPVAITLRRCSIQARMVASNSFCPIELEISCTFSCNSSNGRLSQVRKRCFRVPKRSKSLGAISGEYNGWGILSTLFSATHSSDFLGWWGLALPIWR
jgi:hypothetical protein